MRALFVTRKFPPSVGGMEVYSKELFAAMRELNDQAEICRPRRPILGRPSLIRLAGFFAGASWILLRRARKFDAVLIGDFALAGLAVIAKLASLGRTRVVISLHGNDLFFLRKKTFKASVYRFICRGVIVSRAIDAAIANSRAIKDEATSLGISPVHVITLATSVPQPDQLRTAPAPRNAILFAGRLIRYKGLSWFVREVWPHLDPRLELLVVGTIWDQSEYECLRNQPRIRYLGSLPHAELMELRSQVLACIMPNLPPQSDEQDEGFGLSALEAPAVGTPTVAARCGGLADAVADGTTGFLLPPLEAGMWIRCLNGIVDWPQSQRDEFARRAIEHVLEHFNWRTVAHRTMQVLAGCKPQEGAENMATHP